MDNYFIAIILGILEGITEFLPVSSSAHLALAGKFLNFTGTKAGIFEVVIQLGAILAVVTVYWRKFLNLLLPAKKNDNFSGLKGIYLLCLTTFPVCLCGLLFHSFIKNYLFGSANIVIFLIVGSICMFLVERRSYKPVCPNLNSITPKLALGIGIAQCFALFPGFSRSAATIMGGLLLGASRQTAVIYSFIAAVPVMFAASAYDIYKHLTILEKADLPFFLAGCLCAYLAGLLSIRFFIALLGKITLIPFAAYRIVLAIVVFIFVIK